jgi:hypothetical protein
MPLTFLDLTTPRGVSDLTPLREMNLTEVRLSPKNITKGMDVLRPMKSLKTISVRQGSNQYFLFSPEEFWKKYDAGEFNK